MCEKYHNLRLGRRKPMKQQTAPLGAGKTSAARFSCLLLAFVWVSVCLITSTNISIQILILKSTPPIRRLKSIYWQSIIALDWLHLSATELQEEGAVAGQSYPWLVDGQMKRTSVADDEMKAVMSKWKNIVTFWRQQKQASKRWAKFGWSFSWADQRNQG